MKKLVSSPFDIGMIGIYFFFEEIQNNRKWFSCGDIVLHRKTERHKGLFFGANAFEWFCFRSPKKRQDVRPEREIFKQILVKAKYTTKPK